MFAATFMSAYEYDLSIGLNPRSLGSLHEIVSRVISETITSYILETKMCELLFAGRLHIDNK